MSPSSTLVRLGALTGLALVLSLGLAGPAAADPKGDVITLDCGGTSYDVAVNGNVTIQGANLPTLTQAAEKMGKLAKAKADDAAAAGNA